MNSQEALVVKNPPANAGDITDGFGSWVRKISWRRAWQPTPVFLPGGSHGQRSLVGLQSMRVELDTAARVQAHSTIAERTQQSDRKRRVRSYRDPVFLLQETGRPFPGEMLGRLHVRGSPNNQTLYSKGYIYTAH